MKQPQPKTSRIARWLISAIHAYQRTLSPLLGNCCRHEPSCSRYAALCLYHLPTRAAVWLSLKRLLRCNPLFTGGVDLPPLPPTAPRSDREPDWHRIERMYGLPSTHVATPLSVNMPIARLKTAIVNHHAADADVTESQPK